MKYKFRRDQEITHRSPSQVLPADQEAHIYSICALPAIACGIDLYTLIIY